MAITAIAFPQLDPLPVYTNDYKISSGKKAIITALFMASMACLIGTVVTVGHFVALPLCFACTVLTLISLIVTMLFKISAQREHDSSFDAETARVLNENSSRVTRYQLESDAQFRNSRVTFQQSVEDLLKPYTRNSRVFSAAASEKPTASMGSRLQSTTELRGKTFKLQTGPIEVNFKNYLDCLPEQSKLNVFNNKDRHVNSFLQLFDSPPPKERLEKAFENWLFQKPMICSLENFQAYIDFLKSEKSDFSKLKVLSLAQIETSIQDVYVYLGSHQSAYEETDLIKLINLINEIKKLEVKEIDFLRSDDTTKLLLTAERLESIFTLLDNKEMDMSEKEIQINTVFSHLTDPFVDWKFDDASSLALASLIKNRFNDLALRFSTDEFILNTHYRRAYVIYFNLFGKLFNFPKMDKDTL